MSRPRREVMTRAVSGRFIGGMVAVTILLSLTLLWHHSRMIRLGYEIERLKAQKTGLERTHRELVIERESLVSLERIERLAADLALVHPAPRDRVVVNVPIPSPEDPKTHAEFMLALSRRVSPTEAHAAP